MGARGPKAKPFWSHAERTDGCWEWQGSCFSNGYGRTFLKSKGVGAHRRAWELTYGPIPAGQLVCHRCDNKRCVRPDHLFLGTVADNSRDMVEKGRSLKGERSYNARLNSAAVAEIRRRYAAGQITQAELAAEHGVVEGTVWNVLHGHSWTHVSEGIG